MKINKSVLSIMSIIAALMFAGCKNGSGASGFAGGNAKTKTSRTHTKMEVAVSGSEVRGGQSVWKIAERNPDTDKEMKKLHSALTESLTTAGLDTAVAENTADILTSMELMFTAEVGKGPGGGIILMLGKKGDFGIEAFFDRDREKLDGTYSGSFSKIHNLEGGKIAELMSKCELKLVIPADAIEGEGAAQKIKDGKKIKFACEFK